MRGGYALPNSRCKKRLNAAACLQRFCKLRAEENGLFDVPLPPVCGRLPESSQPLRTHTEASRCHLFVFWPLLALCEARSDPHERTDRKKRKTKVLPIDSRFHETSLERTTEETRQHIQGADTDMSTQSPVTELAWMNRVPPWGLQLGEPR